MPEDYQAAVLAAYKQKRQQEEGGLPINLLRPTVVKIKKACLRKYDSSEEAKDVFSEFFDKDKISTDFYSIIKNADEGSFRPLLNHLNGITTRTDGKNTELLAWLIDFEPRPSISYYNSFSTEPEKNDGEKVPPTPEEAGGYKENALDEIEDEENTGLNGSDESEPGCVENITPEDKQPITTQTRINEPSSSSSPHQILISCTIFLILGIGLYQFQQNKPGISGSFNTLFSSGNEKCMYWTGDSYQAVACDAGPKGGQTIPLNVDKMRKFRRVMQPDTLTKDALGKVWYAKRGGMIEFYTDSGAHPTDGNKRLLPVTGYILNKYISYHRYLLNLIFWSAGIIIFSLIFGIGTIYFGRKAKKQRAGTKKQQVKAAA